MSAFGMIKKVVSPKLFLGSFCCQNFSKSHQRVANLLHPRCNI